MLLGGWENKSRQLRKLYNDNDVHPVIFSLV